MGKHCSNCNCGEQKKVFGFKRSTFVKMLVGWCAFFFICMSIMMLVHFAKNKFKGWSEMEYFIFLLLLIPFACFYIAVVYMEATTFLEGIWSIMCGLYAYLWDFLYYVRDHIRIPTLKDTRTRFSARGTASRARGRAEASNSGSESDEERPPLPPKNKKIAEAAEAIPFQKLTSGVHQGASSSTAHADESEDFLSQLLDRPSFSTQPSPPPAASRRRTRSSSAKERFRRMLDSIPNLKSIVEEGEPSQEDWSVQIPLSALTRNPGSIDADEQETSFVQDSQLTEMEEQKLATQAAGSVSRREQASGVFELQAQERTSGTSDKSRSPGQTSVTTMGDFSLGKIKSSIPKETEKKRSLEQPSTSRYVPQVHACGSGVMQASASENSGLRRQTRTYDFQRMQEDREQTSRSYVGLRELEKQSGEFDPTGTERKQSSPEKPPAPIYVKVTVLNDRPQVCGISETERSQTTEEQSSAPSVSSSQRQAVTSDTQRRQASEAHSSTSYVRLSELEKQSREFDSRSEKQNSPEQPSTSSYVPFSTLQTQAKALGFGETRGAQAIQKEAAPIDIPGSPRRARASDIQRMQECREQTSSSYVGLPELEKQSREFGSKRTEKQSSPEQPSTSSYVPFSTLQRQAQAFGFDETRGAQAVQKEAAPIDIPGSPRRARASDIQRMQESRGQTSSSYVGLPELEKQSREFGSTEKQSSPEQPSTSNYVPFSKLQRQAQALGFDESEGAQAVKKEAAPIDFPGSPRRARAPDIQKMQQTSSRSYVGYPELEKQSREFSAGRAERKQSSPEQSPMPNYVKFSVLRNQPQAPVMEENQRRQTTREQSAATVLSSTPKKEQTSDIQRRQASREQTSSASYVTFSELEKQSRERRQSPEQPSRYVPFLALQNQPQASGVDETVRIQGSRGQASGAESSVSSIERESWGTDVLQKLRNLQEASVTGFSGETIQSREPQVGPARIPLAHYVRVKRLSGENESEMTLNQKRRCMFSSTGPEKSTHKSETRGVRRKEKSTEESRERTSGYSARKSVERVPGTQRQQITEQSSAGYLPHSSLSGLESTSTRETVMKSSSTRRDVVDQNVQQSPKESSPRNLEAVKQETNKETFLSLNLATGGLVLSSRETKRNESTLASGTDPWKSSFMYDQQMGVLDLSHIEVPLPPTDDEEEEDESQKKEESKN